VMLLPNAMNRVAANTGAEDTVTLNVHEPVCCASSVAVHVTVVVPSGKTVPLAGAQLTATGFAPAAKVGAGYETGVGPPLGD